MLNKHFILILLLFSLLGCKKDNPNESAIEEINVTLQLERFDQILFGGKPSDLSKIRANYPAFFVDEVPDSVYVHKITDSLYRELFEEVQKTFPDIQVYKSGIEKILQRSKFYFPNYKTPNKLVSLISEMDYQNKVIYTDSLLVLSLDLYLGENHKYYVGEFYDYQRKLFTENQILPDVADALVRKIIPKSKETIFVEQMVAEGKIQYLKQQLLPETPEHLIIGYSEKEFNWCLANEMYMWQYFVDSNLLFETGQKNIHRFISPAPFSKFYLDIDPQSPGRVGVWLGWQIVKSYMDKNKSTLEELLNTEPKLIYENAKYKPKKS
jgi:gliding motility-associated lipoprotein GldB